MKTKEVAEKAFPQLEDDKLKHVPTTAINDLEAHVGHPSACQQTFSATSKAMVRRSIARWFLLLLVVGAARAESARSLVSKGNEAYAKEQYGEAYDRYEEAAQSEPNSAHILFNKGNALYKQGEFTKAIDAFERAAIHSQDKSLEARSKFNQGNASFREGVRQSQGNPGQALASVGKSVQLYQEALKLDPRLDDARHNIEVARRVMKQLMEQMQNQPQQGDQDKKSEDAQNKDGQEQSGQQKQESAEQNQEGQHEQQQEQQQSQAARQQQREKKPPQAAETPEDILRKERDNRKQRHLRAVVGIRPVDKDW